MDTLQLDFNRVEKLIEQGYISVRRHPTAPISIYNYTPQCQFDWHWTQETIACRGLILDDDKNVVSRPFPKFFTPDQYRDLRSSMKQLYGVRYRDAYKGGFSVTEKMDGSLGILYYHPECGVGIATRGSFESEQAKHATKLLYKEHPNFLFRSGCTYLFEIIYPQNRIVVDYGARDELVLLTVLNNKTGEEDLSLMDEWVRKDLPSVKWFSFKSFDEVLHRGNNQVLRGDKEEGYVVKFDNGLRVKIKFADYLRLHRILTNVTARSIWQYLKNHDVKTQQSVLEMVPDEFHKWVIDTEYGLISQFLEIEEKVVTMLKACVAMNWIPDNRKAIAMHFPSSPERAILFMMVDNKDYSDAIWKMIRPGAERPFDA